MNINLEVNLHNAFKAATAAQGVDMTTVLQQFIEKITLLKTAMSNVQPPKYRAFPPLFVLFCERSFYLDCGLVALLPSLHSMASTLRNWPRKVSLTSPCSF